MIKRRSSEPLAATRRTPSAAPSRLAKKATTDSAASGDSSRLRGFSRTLHTETTPGGKSRCHALFQNSIFGAHNSGSIGYGEGGLELCHVYNWAHSHPQQYFKHTELCRGNARTVQFWHFIIRQNSRSMTMVAFFNCSLRRERGVGERGPTCT